MERFRIKQSHIPIVFKKACGEQFFGVPYDVFLTSLDVYQFRVYMCLLTHLGGSGNPDVSVVSYSVLSEQTRISLLKVKNTVHELADLNLLSISRRSHENGGNLPNEYSIYYPRASRYAVES